MKRKNNNRSYEKPGDNCGIESGGVDINRNYDFHWGTPDGPCDGSYAGPHAFSEPES